MCACVHTQAHLKNCVFIVIYFIVIVIIMNEFRQTLSYYNQSYYNQHYLHTITNELT